MKSNVVMQFGQVEGASEYKNKRTKGVGLWRIVTVNKGGHDGHTHQHRRDVKRFGGRG